MGVGKGSLKNSFHLILLACALAAGCASHSGGPRDYQKIVLHPPKSVKDGPQHPIDGLIPGVDDFGLISNDVWRGSEPTAEGFRTLASLGVKTVIDLREGDESDSIPQGVRYVHLPTSAWHADTDNVKAVLDAIASSPKPVFIHCHQGRDRTGLAVAAYRLWQHMSAKDACRELRSFRVNPWWAGSIEQRIYALSRHEVDEQRLAHLSSSSAGSAD
jgi:protein tyrosine phosphatase (PTP) superfamily phosphohydrolase (DUF442 family)